MIIVNYRYKKYTNYPSVYINIKIVKTSKYTLSCIRCYIVIAICRLQLLNDHVIPKGLKLLMYKL